jgi:hypothetical protein
VGHIRIVLDVASPSYDLIDATMERLGYERRIPGMVGEQEQWFALPQGSFWREEPTTARELFDHAMLALHAADELGAQVVVTAGETSYAGLVPCDGPVSTPPTDDTGT